MADRLYARLASAVDAHVGSELQALSERAKTASAATTTAPAGAGSESGDYGAEDSSRALFFLPQFDATWRSHCACMLTLRQVFAPLDAATATGSAANRGGGGANTSAAAGKAVAASPSSFSTSSAAAAAAASVVAARQPLHEMGLALFRAHLSAHPEVATRAAAGLLATVAAERRLSGAAAEAAMAAATGVEIPHGLPSSAAPSAPATPVDRGLAASVSRALAALSLYQRALEAPLLARSDAFYRAEGSRLLACPALPPALYLRHAERRLAEEAERALAYLERGTRAPLMKVAEAQLLARHIPALLEAGVPAFFDADLPLGGGGGGRGGGGGGGGEEAMATDDGAAAPPPPPAAATSSAAAAADQLLRNRVGISGDGLDDLRRLSAAASRVRASDALRAAFKAHVKSRGEGLMMAAAAPASAGGDAAAAASASKRLIPDLLLLKSRADAAVRGAFGSREAFAVALKEAFEGFINRQGGRAAELLAKHVDAELRGGASGMKASDRAAAAAAAAAAASKQPEQQQPEEADLDQRLDAALALFRFVEGKDVFEAFYKRDLARRLLLGGGDPSSSSSTSSSADSDAERAVLAKLKVECGAGFTSKLEGMFKDVALSKELLSSFRASAEAAAARERGALPANLDVSVSVLTAGFWPTYGGVGVGGGGGGSGGGGETGGGSGGGNPSPTVGARASDATATPAGGATSSSPTFLLPSPLSGAAAAFADHYLQKHRGRRLTWMHELSTAVLRARFDGSGSGGGSSAAPKPAQSKELIVSLHQASVLLLFNDVEAPSGGGGGGGGAGALSLAQVAERTGLPAREARLVLASLALARVRPLVREAAGGAAAAAPAVGTAAPAAGGGLAAAAASISETDSFRVAASVASPLFRVRLNAAQLRESSSNSASDESRRIGEAVDQDRAHAVDAAIVRIMKTRRSLAHKLLARELAAQLRFAVAGPALKKRVESLIDREFLARDEADPSVYNYLA